MMQLFNAGQLGLENGVEPHLGFKVVHRSAIADWPTRANVRARLAQPV